VTRLLILRHGQTAWNANDRVQGQTDIDLDDTGRDQARRVAPVLATYHPDLIVSSDLKRAAQTADALSALVGLPVELDQRLRERNYGPWQGLSLPEIEQAFPEAYQLWRSGKPFRLDGLESVGDVSKRTTLALLDAAERVGKGTAVVVCHGHSARSAICGVLNWPDEVVRSMGALRNCHFAEMRHTAGRGWQLRAYNLGAAHAIEHVK
jgi:probable phosphoglycerate mutase